MGGWIGFRSMRRMEARRRKARGLWLRHSQSLASRRQRPSQAKVRPTIQRLAVRRSLWLIRSLDDLDVDARQNPFHRARNSGLW